MSTCCRTCVRYIKRSNPSDGIKCKDCNLEFDGDNLLKALKSSDLLCDCHTVDKLTPTKLAGYGLCLCGKYRRVTSVKPITVCSVFVKRSNPLDGIKCKDCNIEFSGKKAYAAIRRSGLLCTCHSTSAPTPTRIEEYGLCRCGNYRRIRNSDEVPKKVKKVSFSKYITVYSIPSD